MTTRCSISGTMGRALRFVARKLTHSRVESWNVCFGLIPKTDIPLIVGALAGQQQQRYPIGMLARYRSRSVFPLQGRRNRGGGQGGPFPPTLFPQDENLE